MFSIVRVEVLTVGDELLRGDIVDTNSAFLCGRLLELGLPVSATLSVGDALEGLVETLSAVGQRADLVVVSGGLGPTDDDRTAEAAARAASVSRVLHEPSVQAMRERFATIGYEMTENNLNQARIPQGADVLANAEGTAPGFALTLGHAQMFFLPGVPRELCAMFDREVAPRVAILGRKQWVRTLRIFRMGESHIDQRLKGLHSADVSIHYQARFPENLVKLVSEDAEALARTEKAIRERLGPVIYGVDNETLAHRVGQALRAKKATLALAESCTGGLIGHLLTEIPGSSDYFRLGLVAYSNESKSQLLGVQEATLRTPGAVSETCVLEMADGARRVAQTTFGLAVSGIAGPSGGTPEKPVGTVHMAVVGPEKSWARKLYYPGARDRIKLLSAYAALALLLRACEGEAA